MKKDKLKVLVVLTSHDQLGDTGEKTDCLDRRILQRLYYVLQDAGVDVTIASPKGGQPPIDSKSALPDFQYHNQK
jgi:hypothetical protein